MKMLFKPFTLTTMTLSLMALSSISYANEAKIALLEKQISAQSEAIAELKKSIEQQENQEDLLKNTSLGGYGEAQYYNYNNTDQQYDAYRYVMYIGHKFSDNVRMHSELEVEHGFFSADKGAGELELEQMYLDWQYTANHQLGFGQMLMPVGFLNETHEPDTFYGTKRNPIETNIIPTTWWEGGIKASGLISANLGLGYDFMVSSGLKNSEGNIRSARQKGSKASAEELSYTARLRYDNAGLNAGLVYHKQADLTQGKGNPKQDADLIEAHVAYNYQGVGLKALYASWDINGLEKTAFKSKGKQSGYFVETNYRFHQAPIDKFGIFARFSEWDTAKEANLAGINDASNIKQVNYGFNYYLTPRAVLKVDIQDQKGNPADKDEDGFSLGIGYSF